MNEFLSKILSFLFLILSCFFMFFSEFTYADQYEPIYDSDYRDYLQNDITIEIDSLKDLSGERYRLEWDKKSKEKIWDYRTWASFKTEKSVILKNQVYYKDVISNADKKFFYEYFLRNQLNEFDVSNAKTVIIDSLECKYRFSQTQSTLDLFGGKIDILTWLMFDRISKNYFYGESTGHRVELPNEVKKKYPNKKKSQRR